MRRFKPGALSVEVAFALSRSLSQLRAIKHEGMSWRDTEAIVVSNFDEAVESNGVMNLTYNGVEMSIKEYLTYACNRGKGPGFVVKQVAEDWVQTNRITFLKGTVDLALEAKYLASLSHPNIIEVKAVAEGGPFREGYFLILDRLHETLPTKLKKWTTIDRQCKGITGVFVGGKKKQQFLSLNRMEAAYGVANALKYIHSVNLVYRDLVSMDRLICCLVVTYRH